MWNLALMVNESDPSDAARWLAIAASHGHAKAATRLGVYEAARGDVDEGLRWLTRAQELGDDEAPPAIAALRRQREAAGRPRGGLWRRRNKGGA